MKNISFDNPYLLLVAIPLLLLVLIPHFIAIRKTNRSLATRISLFLHIVIICFSTLALAGMKHTTIMTKTEVYVVADVSYSDTQNLELIDEYIAGINDKLPENSEYGVVCFGKDQVLNTEMGGEFVTVKESGADDSATDIASALNYAAELFSDDTIKRILLITDGRHTSSDGNARMVQAVQNLVSDNIYIDAVYVDSNIGEDAVEVQINGVDASDATYLNHESRADVLIYSASDVTAVLTVTKDGVEYSKTAPSLSAGYNVVSVELPTDAAGEFDYDVSVSLRDDGCEYNNSYSFSQRVVSEVRALVSVTSLEDLQAVLDLYGTDAALDIYFNDGQNNSRWAIVKRRFADVRGFEHFVFHMPDGVDRVLAEEEPDNYDTEPSYKEVNIYITQAGRDGEYNPNVPCTVEELCLYDEFLLVNTDVRTFSNFVSFVECLDLVVSKFGKSLVTIGDTFIQNKTDDILQRLENMLPLKFGNNNDASKLYILVIDCSLSMVGANRMEMAKSAAKQLVTLMTDTDQVGIIPFSGSIDEPMLPRVTTDAKFINDYIDAIEGKQGTAIGFALNQAYTMAAQYYKDYSETHVILISDGIKGATETYNAGELAKAAFDDNGVITSVMNINSTKTDTLDPESYLKNIQKKGGGKYYFLSSLKDMDAEILEGIGDDMTGALIEVSSTVDLVREHDETLQGVFSLPSISNYIFATTKNDVTVTEVMTAEFIKASGAIGVSTIYAYKEHGNGRVTCFTGNIAGLGTENWQNNESAARFFENLYTTNIPEERIDYPYSINIESDGDEARVEIVPAQLKSDSKMIATVTTPSGQITEKTLYFNVNGFYLSFDTPELGRYDISLTYSYAGSSHESETMFYYSYAPEYDSFAYYTPSTLLRAIGGNGTVSEDGIPELVNDEDRIGTYVVEFVIPFMIVAICLYVIDLAVRKFKLSDIKSLFRKIKKGGKTK